MHSPVDSRKNLMGKNAVKKSKYIEARILKRMEFSFGKFGELRNYAGKNFLCNDVMNGRFIMRSRWLLRCAIYFAFTLKVIKKISKSIEFF